MPKNIVIGIEGLVGAGKTSICRQLLNDLPNSVLLNGGNLYRSIIVTLLQQGDNLNKLAKNLQDVDIKDVMDKLNIEIKIENKETQFYANGKKIEEEDMQSSKSSMAVSTIGGMANNEHLFIFARELINNLKQKYNVIISGRAIMQIYPDTDYHFFVTASLDERVKRKNKQYPKMNGEELREHISQRDALQEKAGFYKLSPKTISIDVTECKTVEESTNKLLKKIELFK